MRPVPGLSTLAGRGGVRMRARSIKPSFFENEALAECSPHARLLFAALWCMADKAGRLEDRPKRIGALAFPYEQVDAGALLDELANKRDADGGPAFIERYRADGRGYIQVVNFERHQSPHHRERDSEIPGKPETSPEKARPSPGKVGPGPEKARPSPSDSGLLTPDSGLLTEDNGQGTEDKGAGAPSPDASIGDFVSAWNDAAREGGWPVIRSMTGKRKKALQARLKDPDWRGLWREALDKAKASPFLRGHNDRGWTLNVDFFLRPDSVAKIAEGAYSDGRTSGAGVFGCDNPDAPW